MQGLPRGMPPACPAPRPRHQCRLFHGGKPRDQWRPPWLDKHIRKTLAHHSGIAAMAAGQHQRQVCALPDQIGQAVCSVQHFACMTGFQNRIRMHDNAVPGVGNVDADQARRCCQYQSAQQHRAHVVAMATAAGNGFALDGKWIEFPCLQGPIKQRVGSHQRGHAGCGGATHARTHGNALVEFDAESEGQAKCFAQRDEGATGGVALRLDGQCRNAASNGLDAHHWLGNAPDRGAVTWPGKALAKDVETYRNVADAGRGKGAGRTQRRAPKAAPRRSKSAKIPAAVTSRPAPGPCTIIGLSA